MIVSFFRNGHFVLSEDHTYTPSETIDGVTEPATGHPDCIHVEDVDFDPNNQVIHLEGKKVVIENLPINPPDKHSRIYQSLITTESLENFDLEGEIFSDFEIGEIIMARVFGGNPHAKSALDAKLFSMLISGTPNPELLQKAQEIEAKTNTIRNIFNLGNL